MEYRYLGNSGLKISEIAYGNWLTHASQVEAERAEACVRAALDAGITTFDTADFPEATVWSGFGQGYGYIPLLLPIVGLIWLRRTRPLTDRSTETAGDRA